ncbi:Isopropylmalate/homocitrate/citramalate synthase [Candidatus Burkholderia verschuerenii]|uniref:Isopropylmalate/homocitrate/citramalate synthase n=1 Tax=Candidatus Burkholderia verschuerenii TaxID=242163 RepID=A0A0L0MHV2_9BURK|nr:DUF5594 family protein [Candidatus Burkholderia verschuerenii]KND61886.1 Isopropylmalate/homocitrate/citramalate synthase [Candidatus Burkholderia verschuerenii]
MNREQALRFETEFMPRIVAEVARVLDRGVRVEFVPFENLLLPTRLHASAARHGIGERGSRYPFDLNVFLTWDDDEIVRLLRPDGEARFLRYLESIGAKLRAWEGVREIDLISRSQAEATVLVGGLDFEA